MTAFLIISALIIGLVVGAVSMVLTILLYFAKALNR